MNLGWENARLMNIHIHFIWGRSRKSPMWLWRTGREKFAVCIFLTHFCQNITKTHFLVRIKALVCIAAIALGEFTIRISNNGIGIEECVHIGPPLKEGENIHQNCRKILYGNTVSFHPRCYSWPRVCDLKLYVGEYVAAFHIQNTSHWIADFWLTWSGFATDVQETATLSKGQYQAASNVTGQ